MIRQRGKSLQIQVYAGRDPLTGGKRYKSETVPGTTRASWNEAKQVEGRLLAEVAAGKHRGTKAMKVEQLLDEWLTWRESNGKPISPSTLHNYRLTVETKIKPGLGHLKVSAVDARVLDRFYTALRKSGNARPRRDEAESNGETSKGRRPRRATSQPEPPEQDGSEAKPKQARAKQGGPLSASRVRDVHAILSGALGLAARWGMIPHNPALLAKPPAPRNAPRKLPTPEQAKALLAAAAKDDPEFEVFLRIGASTGLRRGEVCALRWGDLRLDQGELIVSGSVLFLRTLEGGYARTPPKSEHGERVLALDPRTVKLLRAHSTRSKERAMNAGARLSDGAYLFSTKVDGSRPIRPDFISRRFSKLAEGLGHDYTLHGLRHFVATQLGTVAEAGTIRTRLGHGSLAVSSLYVHPTAKADRAAAEYMGNVLDG